MTELLIGLACCLGMAGSLLGYLAVVKKKYYKGKDPSSLSRTFYHTGWKFRVLLISMVLFLVYPILLAYGFYDNGWVYYAPTELISWAKLMLALCMGGIIGVALNADYLHNEDKPHVAAAAWIAAGFAMIGTMLRPEWYIGLGIWLAWLVYYVIKNHLNNKKGNPSAAGLYIELVAFMSVPTCLATYIILNYLGC